MATPPAVAIPPAVVTHQAVGVERGENKETSALPTPPSPETEVLRVTQERCECGGVGVCAYACVCAFLSVQILGVYWAGVTTDGQ